MSFFEELKRRNVFRVGFAYTMVGWLVAQVADLTFESFGAPDWVMKTLLFLMFIGFLAALFIAWAYEITPEGVKRAEDVDPNQSITLQTGRKLDRLVIVVLLISVALLVFDRFQSDSTPTPQAPVVENTDLQTAPANQHINEILANNADRQGPSSTPAERSVAVLPFVNMSSDPEQEYFSDGISEEILNVLTRIPNLKVAARTSSFQFKGQNLDIADIGRQLKVNHLLEGSVRKAGNTLRITAQLVKTDTGFHLWSQTFDRNPEDVFAIQDEIAEAISTELLTLFTSKVNANSTPIDIQAYELYLKGRGLIARRSDAELLEGIDTLKAAIAIEPQYSPALATLGKAYAVLPWFSEKIPAGIAREQARQWASKALEIGPENTEALAVLGIVHGEVDLNFSGALEVLQKAVQLNPGSVAANNFLGDLYTRIGNLGEAMKYESRAAELDPLGPVQLTDLANIYLIRGDYEKVVTLANRALQLDPTFQNARQLLSDAWFAIGDVEQITRAFEAAESMSSLMGARIESMQIKLDVDHGHRKQAEEKFRNHVLRAKSQESPSVDVAYNAVMLGDYDTAGEMLLQAYAEKDGTWIYPVWVRLPEQAPDSKPWQEFWRQPGVKELADLRRTNGLNLNLPTFGSGAKP